MSLNLSNNSIIINDNLNVFLETLKDIVIAGRDAIKPAAKMAVSEWAEEFRIVSPEVTARPGKWRNDTVPFAVEIMDCASDPDIEKLSLWGSAQICKTEIILNIIGYFIHVNPSAMIILQPTLEMARAFSKSKLEYMIRDCYPIRERISENKAKSQDNAILHKKFTGGELDIAGGNSPMSLAMRSKKVSICDDVDRIPASAGDEGDPVKLAEKRTTTFPNRFNFSASTCTVKGRSRIEKLYNASDRRKPWVPCSKCGEYQILRFGGKGTNYGLKWDKDTDLLGRTLVHYPETVVYVCEHCGSALTEKDKVSMISKVEWRAEKPEVKKHRGYWINELYSPFSSWEKIVRDFLDCGDDQELLKVFFNTSLAELWVEEHSDEIDETGLLQRTEEFGTYEIPQIPNDILFITVGVDTQPDRLEAHVIGWGIGEESWVIAYEKLWGDPDQDDVWDDLDALLNKKWKRKDGVELRIGAVFPNGKVNRATFIDANGKNTQSVYDQTRKRQYKGVVAIMGRSGEGKHVLLNRSLVNKNKDTILQNICVDTAKEALYSRLTKTGDGPKVIHFSKGCCDIDYFMGITAEKRVKEYDRKNGERYIWKKKSKGRRNEQLDTWVYAYAAMKSIPVNYVQLKENYELQAKKITEQDEKPETSARPVIVQTTKRRVSETRMRSNNSISSIRKMYS